MIKDYHYLTRVRYADIDQMGIVYYSRYFEFFEAARTDMLRDMGLPYSKFEETGYFLPVIESHCEYSQGAQFDRLIDVKCIIEEIPKVKIKIGYVITDYENGTLLVTGYTVHAFLNSEKKPCRAPLEFLKILK
ncbi:MAG: acyl-CoA thioesterase [Candidatus Marinimicrobia bacterium]|nr:acyl-CoA thioesterase [Candidatus Neomarinimicrobiota bacterium]